MKPRLIAVCNLSTVVDNKSLDIIMEAADQWYSTLFLPTFNAAGTAKIDLYPDIDCLPNDSEHCLLLDDADQIGAAAYHQKTGRGLPQLKVFFRTILLTGHTLLGKDGGLSAFCHELGENDRDPGCNIWADDGTGVEHAKEQCDAIQNTGFAIKAKGQEAWVSNFLFDEWFDSMSPPTSQYDFMGVLKQPFELGDGYDITRVDGEIITLQRLVLPAHKIDMHSRYAKRLAAVGGKQ